MRKSFLLLLLQISLLTACATAATTPAPTTALTPTPLASNTPTPIPTDTATPEPTSTPLAEFALNATGELTQLNATNAYDLVELNVPLLKDIKIQEVRNIAPDIYEAYDTQGRLMLVNDGTGWVTAPLGMKVDNATWYSWNKIEGQEPAWLPEWKMPDFNERLGEVAQIVQKELVDPNVPAVGTAGCVAPELCFKMRVNPEMEQQAYRDFLEALINSKNTEVRRFWREFGYPGGGVEKFVEVLEKSVGGPENAPYWVPATTAQGTKFMSLHSSKAGATNSQFAVNQAVQRAGGFYLDRLSFGMFSYPEWTTNPWVSAWFKHLIKGNASKPKSYLYDSWSIDERSVFGLQVMSNLRLVFINGTVWPFPDRGFSQAILLGGGRRRFSGS